MDQLDQSLRIATISTVMFLAGIGFTINFIKVQADKNSYALGREHGYEDGYEYGYDKGFEDCFKAGKNQ